MPGQPSSRSSTIAIQVVAGLVQDKHVGLVQDRQQQRQATALAARKIADATPELLCRKAQALAKFLGRSLLAVDDVVLLIVAEHLADRVTHVGLEFLELLRQNAKAHRLANLHTAARGLNLALNHVEQGRLAGAVLAHQSHDRAALHIQIDVIQHPVPAEGLAHAAD